MRSIDSGTARRRRIARGRRRVRCRLCGAYEAKRFCPAVNAQICPYCCADMRGKRTACETCKYNPYATVTSRELRQPDVKFYKALVSDSENAGMLDLAVSWEKSDGRLKAIFFLLDFWKQGLKDCMVDVGIGKEEFQQRCSHLAGHPAKEISLDEAKKLIKRGLHISRAVGTPIPWDYQRWKSLLGDMSHVPEPEGSLYKCSRCGAELSEPIVEIIKRHAQSEDAHFYMVCEKCAGDFED